MKNKIYTLIALIVCISACNDDYSNQFNINYPIIDTLNKTITLSPDAYAAVASNDSNQKIALALDPENGVFQTALKAVGTNKYFTETAPAETYLPAYLSSIYPFADPDSKFVVTYNQFQEESSYMSDFDNISNFTFTSANYDEAWSGNNTSVSFLTPATVSKIPSILNNNVADAEQGAMKVVNYAFSSVEPSSSTPSVSISNISDVLADVPKSEHNIKGTVIATNAQSMLVNDNTGTILIYMGNMPNYSIGDILTINGATSSYAGMIQISKPASIIYNSKKSSFAYPIPTPMDAESLTNYIASPSVKYISLNGTLTKSNNYYNLVVNGFTKKGSIQYPVARTINTDLIDKQVTVIGYLTGTTNQFFNIMPTSVTLSGESSEFTKIGMLSYIANGGYSVAGTVAATYSKGFLLTDGTGNVLVYQGINPTCSVGDVVDVKGDVTEVGGLKQFGKSSTIIPITTGGTFKQPSVRELDAKALDAYVSQQYSAYVQYSGTLSIADNKYYNVKIDGATTAIGSISNPTDGLVDASLNGKKVIVTGYLIGLSGGKYVNTMATSVVDATTTRAMNYGGKSNLFTRAGEILPNTSVIYRYDGTSWSLYSLTGDTRLVVAQPSLYSQLGISYIINPNFVLPQYLSTEVPYSQNGDKAVVVYNKATNVPVAKEYTYDSGWSETTTSIPMTTTFTVEADRTISADISTFYSNSFLGDTGGFTIQNVNLGGLNNVWINTSNYGWKATGYVNKQNNETESWIISPAISLAKAESPILTFDEAHRYTNDLSPEEFFTVLISTDYSGDATTATWTTLQVPNWSDGTNWDFVNIGNIDLKDYIGKTIYIAFRYISTTTSAPTWEVKNLIIQEPIEE